MEIKCVEYADRASARSRHQRAAAEDARQPMATARAARRPDAPAPAIRIPASGQGTLSIAQRALIRGLQHSPRGMAQRALGERLQAGPGASALRTLSAAVQGARSAGTHTVADGAAAVTQRFRAGEVEYSRQTGGSVAMLTSQTFGDQAAPPPTRTGEVAFVANVPTAGGILPVATRYAEGWSDPGEMARRQRLVIGVNTFQSLGESLAAAQARLDGLVLGGVPEGIRGTALKFVWRPNWLPPWPAEVLPLTDAEKAAEREQAIKENLPYGLFRSTVLSSAPTSAYATAFAGAGYLPYVHVADPDSPSFKVPAGRQRPGGAKVSLSGSFAAESEERLFDRLTTLIERRRAARDRHPAKDPPTVLAGGYQLRPSSADVAIPLSIIASQIDMQVRRVLYSKGTSATAAYLPEPNLLVNWADIPKQEGTQLARPDLFGSGSGESRELMKNLIQELEARGLTSAEIRRRVAFKPAAAVATGATEGGDRFRAVTEQRARAAGATTLDAAFRSILRSGQSHANPSTWPERARHAAGLAGNAALQRARHLLKNPPAGIAGPECLAVIQALAGPGERNAKPGSLSTAKDRELEDLATETVRVIAAYQPAIAQVIAR